MRRLSLLRECPRMTRLLQDPIMKAKAREADKIGEEANVGDVHNEGELNLFETKTTMKKRDIVVKMTNATIVARVATSLGIDDSSKHKAMLPPLREVHNDSEEDWDFQVSFAVEEPEELATACTVEPEQETALSTVSKIDFSNDWLVDSGCSNHMTG